MMRIRIRLININADPDEDPDFYLMRIRMRIQATKMIRILADADPQHWDKVGQIPKNNSQSHLMVCWN